MNARERKALCTRVVRMRDKRHLSWAQIGDEIDHSAATARRLYDEAKGDGAHVGLLPGKGGRLPAPPPAAKRRTRRAAA